MMATIQTHYGKCRHILGDGRMAGAESIITIMALISCA